MRNLRLPRKVFVMHVETYDANKDQWSHLGQVLLPDGAFREEIAHALSVFGLQIPTFADRLSWSYAVLPGPSGPLPWPRAWILDARGEFLARLSSGPKGSPAVPPNGMQKNST